MSDTVLARLLTLGFDVSDVIDAYAYYSVEIWDVDGGLTGE
jgi:hypothetical protein